MSGKQMLRFVAWVAGMAAIFFIFLWIGFAVQSRRAYRAGERALSEGAEIMAQGYFERSIRSYSPFNRWGKKSAEQLRIMAQNYEDHGAVVRAIDTYQSLMTSLAAIHTGWGKKRSSTIEELEQKIAELRKSLEPES